MTEHTTTDTPRSKAHDAFDDVLDQLAKQGASSGANLLHRFLEPGTRERLKKWADSIGLLWILRLLFPWKNTRLGHAAGEFWSDFTEKFSEKLKEDHDETAGEAEPAKETKKKINRIFEIALAVVQLDEATRDDFLEWWLSDDLRRNAFIKLVKGASEEEIRKLASLPKSELDRLVSPLKESPKPKEEPYDFTSINKWLNDQADEIEAGTNAILAEHKKKQEQRLGPRIKRGFLTVVRRVKYAGWLMMFLIKRRFQRSRPTQLKIDFRAR
jgi:hypothetical protein